MAQADEQTKNAGQTPDELGIERIIDPDHTLVRLARSIDWARMERRFVQTYVPADQEHALPVRLTVGLAILKQMYELSDEALCQRWVENPYYQFFCGETTLQHRPPFDAALVSALPSIGDKRMLALFREGVGGTEADQGIHGAGFAQAYGPGSTIPSPVATESKAAPETVGSKPASIYDVAKRAGVSIKTVSLVINHRPNVSSKTRAAVLEAIRALSYRPNVFAQGLASERAYLIALLNDRPSTGYVSDLQFGALERCRESGYHLIVEPLEGVGDDLMRRVRKLLASTGLHGVIIPPPLCDSIPLLEEIQRTHTPCVRISPGTFFPGLLSVGIDDHKAGYDVTAYLISLGHRRIGFIKGHPGHGASANRFAGYRSALAAFDIPYDETLCSQGFFTFQSGREAAEQLLSRKVRPTAIFAANDEMAAGVLAAAQRFNIKVPTDLSVTGFDDLMAAKIVWPQLTTCRQPIKEIAASAITLLLKRDLAGTSTDQRLDHELIVRDLTARPPQS